MWVCAMESWLRWGCSLEFGCRTLRACSVNLFTPRGGYAKAPGALAVACAVGPRGGAGAFLVDYTICFFLSAFVLVRGGGEVLFCCWG